MIDWFVLPTPLPPLSLVTAYPFSISPFTCAKPQHGNILIWSYVVLAMEQGRGKTPIGTVSPATNSPTTTTTEPPGTTVGMAGMIASSSPDTASESERRKNSRGAHREGDREADEEIPTAVIGRTPRVTEGPQKRSRMGVRVLHPSSSKVSTFVYI